MLEKGKVSMIVQIGKETNQEKTEQHELLPPDTFDEFLQNGFGLPYHQILFMTGKELRDIGDLRVLGAYMKSRGYLSTLTDQNYIPQKLKIVKLVMKWKVRTRYVVNPRSSNFQWISINQSKSPWETQT